jgi:hypothetical protein
MVGKRRWPPAYSFTKFIDVFRQCRMQDISPQLWLAQSTLERPEEVGILDAPGRRRFTAPQSASKGGMAHNGKVEGSVARR